MRARLKLCTAVALLTVGAALVAGGSITRLAVAAPGEDPVPSPTPNLAAACGIDILVILDESGSIAAAGATEDVQAAFRAFTAALKNTGSRMAVSEFSTVARLPLGQRAYTAVTDATIASTFDPYISAGYNPDGSTHWEDALPGRPLLPAPPEPGHAASRRVHHRRRPERDRPRRPRDLRPGNPNVAANEYELKVPLDSNETHGRRQHLAKDRAVSNANALKAQGSHILTVAVGAGLSSRRSLDRIIDVSGPDVFPDTGAFNIATHDVYREPDFANSRPRCATPRSSSAHPR